MYYRVVLQEDTSFLAMRVQLLRNGCLTKSTCQTCHGQA